MHFPQNLMWIGIKLKYMWQNHEVSAVGGDADQLATTASYAAMRQPVPCWRTRRKRNSNA